MEEKLIVRLSNNLGNQMFMYATAYAASKKMNRTLYYDHISSFSVAKNNHHFFALDNFDLSIQPAKEKYFFKGLFGNLNRKILKKLDLYKTKKNFILEISNSNKITYYNPKLLDNIFNENVYMEGYFESEKYFLPHIDEIKKEFTPKDYLDMEKNKYVPEINNTESVSLCIRQNRFLEKQGKINKIDQIKSEQFVSEQINFVNNAIDYFKKKLNKPVFYLWSNDLRDLNKKNNFQDVIFIDNSNIQNKIKRTHCDLYLMTKCKHFAVIPSAFNWWGCWLSKYEKSIILRPNNDYFTSLDIKNKDYWPTKWKKI